MNTTALRDHRTWSRAGVIAAALVVTMGTAAVAAGPVGRAAFGAGSRTGLPGSSVTKRLNGVSPAIRPAAVRPTPSATPSSTPGSTPTTTTPTTSTPTPTPTVVGDTTAPTVDVVAFGDIASESAHGLTTSWPAAVATTAPVPSDPQTGVASAIVTRGAGDTGRTLLPRTGNPDYYGGQLGFTATVDPVRQNYFTVKIWGADASPSWLLLLVDGKEVGIRYNYKFSGQETLLNGNNGRLGAQYVYRTVPLPWNLTRGRTSVSVTLRSLGQFYYYGSGTYESFQRRMTQATPAVLAAYVHLDRQLDTSAEAKPAAVTGALAPAVGYAAYITKWKTAASTRVSQVLAATPSTLVPFKVQFLAQAYEVPWTPAYRNPAALTTTTAAMDAMVRGWTAAPTTWTTGGTDGGCSQWNLFFGDVAEAVRMLWTPDNDAYFQAAMDETTDFGGALGTTTRRAAWSAALQMTRDKERFNRASILNQAITRDVCLYSANAALRKVDPAKAFSEADALRYVYEAVGLSPWRGNDQPGTGTVPVPGVIAPGATFAMVTPVGTGFEGCMAGGDYADGVGSIVWALGRDLADERLQRQGLKMLRARAAQRSDGVDANGNRAVYAQEPVGCRNYHKVNEHIVYLGRGGWQDLAVGASPASEVGEDLVGYLQQAVADNQLVAQVDSYAPFRGSGYYQTVGSVYTPDLLAAVLAQHDTGVRLPMSSGKPDFAWADDTNAVVAAKSGQERLWVALNWRAASSITRSAKVYLTTPGAAYLADVTVDDVRFDATDRYVLGPSTVASTTTVAVPPDNPVNAAQGTVTPLALRTDLRGVAAASQVFGGFATGYTLRYGSWLVGMNPDPTATYTMFLPQALRGAKDLVTGTTYTGRVVTLSPHQTVVFHLGTAAVPLLPAAPLTLKAAGTNAGVTLGWDATPGGTTYRVERSADGTTWTTVATGVTSNRWTDTTATAGAVRSYAVRAVSAQGNAGPRSPVASGAAVTTGHATGWASQDVGTVVLAGTTAVVDGAVRLTQRGGDIADRADALQLDHRPLVGDGTVTARVASLAGSDGWAKAGVMIRTSLAAGSPQVSLLATPSNGTVLRYRTSPGGLTAGTQITGPAVPGWVRLARTGATITASVSADGVTWTTAGTVTVPQSDLVYVGLALTAHSSTKTATATFDGVEVTQG